MFNNFRQPHLHKTPCYLLFFFVYSLPLKSRPQQVCLLRLFKLKLFVQIVIFNFCHIGKVRQDFYKFFCPSFINILKY